MACMLIITSIKVITKYLGKKFLLKKFSQNLIWQIGFFFKKCVKMSEK